MDTKSINAIRFPRYCESHGNIQAIVGGESAGVIFMEKAIYRMSYVGVPLIFQFDKIMTISEHLHQNQLLLMETWFSF